jgi:hypothetical protein
MTFRANKPSPWWQFLLRVAPAQFVLALLLFALALGSGQGQSAGINVIAMVIALLLTFMTGAFRNYVLLVFYAFFQIPLTIVYMWGFLQDIDDVFDCNVDACKDSREPFFYGYFVVSIAALATNMLLNLLIYTLLMERDKEWRNVMEHFYGYGRRRAQT